MTSVYALSENDRNGCFLVESVRRVVAEGHEVHVLAPSFEGRADHTVEGVPVHRFRYFFKRWENLTHFEGAPNRIRNPLYLIVAAFYVLSGLWHAVRLCRRERFDVIHVHWPFPHGIWGYFAGKLSGAPVVLTFHGAELLLTRRFSFVKYFLRHATKHARDIICNSSYTARQAARFTDKPIEVIPYGATVEASVPERDRERPVKEILFAGRLIRRKGLDVLIRALPRIAAEVPVKLHVVSDGPMAGEWKALARQLGVEKDVVFHGIVSNERLKARYGSADVFVLPAVVDDRGDTEGLGIVLIEAISFGVPVVASEVGGIVDIVKHEETGLLVPEKDPEALADAVCRVLKDPELSRRLVRGGLAHVRAYFGWTNITTRLTNVYKQAIAGRA